MMSDDHGPALAEVPDSRDAKIAELERELGHFQRSGIVEVAVRNPSVSEYMTHWESRAERAEAALADRDAKIAELERERDSLLKGHRILNVSGGRLEAQVAELTQKLERATAAVRTADEAIAEYVRYLDGGEMRGSYDGKPERNGLRAAGYKTRAFLNSGASQNG